MTAAERRNEAYDQTVCTMCEKILVGDAAQPGDRYHRSFAGSAYPDADVPDRGHRHHQSGSALCGKYRRSDGRLCAVLPGCGRAFRLVCLHRGHGARRGPAGRNVRPCAGFRVFQCGPLFHRFAGDASDDRRQPRADDLYDAHSRVRARACDAGERHCPRMAAQWRTGHGIPDRHPGVGRVACADCHTRIPPLPGHAGEI